MSCTLIAFIRLSEMARKQSHLMQLLSSSQQAIV